MKKVLALVLTLAVCFNTVVIVSAYTADEPSIISVVTHEEIQDPEQLIQMAVNQSKTRQSSSIKLMPAEEDKAVVMQTLKETTYSDGTVSRECSFTGISVLEEVNGALIARNPVTSKDFQKSGSLGGAYATMKISVESQPIDDGPFSLPIARITSIRASCGSGSSSTYATRVNLHYGVQYEYFYGFSEDQMFNISGTSWVTMYTKDAGYYRIDEGTSEFVAGIATVYLNNGSTFTITMNLYDYRSQLI